MTKYKHFVSRFFTHQDQVNEAVIKLHLLHIPSERIHLMQAKPSSANHPAVADSNHVLKDVLMDAAAGVAVGTGVGIAAEIALVTANLSLFVASPVIAPLVLLGWGAGLGGFLDAAIGASRKAKPFSTLVEEFTGDYQETIQ